MAKTVSLRQRGCSEGGRGMSCVGGLQHETRLVALPSAYRERAVQQQHLCKKPTFSFQKIKANCRIV